MGRLDSPLDDSGERKELVVFRLIRVERQRISKRIDGVHFNT